MTAPDLSLREQATVARFDTANPAPESWELSRCGVKGCDQYGTVRVDFPESWYLMCRAHIAEVGPQRETLSGRVIFP